jgi:antitoxin (DNA-binding transcriptional repressor) of toxin-antitoxin stability system
MHAVSATEFARNFSQMLDQVEHQGITISIVRNHRQVATVVPRLLHQSAMEAFGDLYRPLGGAVKDDWLADVKLVSKSLKGTLSSKAKDPWQ